MQCSLCCQPRKSAIILQYTPNIKPKMEDCHPTLLARWLPDLHDRLQDIYQINFMTVLHPLHWDLG